MPRTFTVRVRSPVRATITSEVFSVRAALTGSPPIFTWPPRHASAARVRVLYSRTAQSHLSIRTGDCKGWSGKRQIRIVPEEIVHALLSPECSGTHSPGESDQGR